MAGIYIHIPFCASRCIYCGFYSTTGKLDIQDRYIDAVLAEFCLRKDYLSGEQVQTVYIGGGTPSLLRARNIERLCNTLYNTGDIIEFTMECNPDDVTPELSHTIASAGVNRVSMGVQTFNDDRLRFLHRRHEAHHISTAINNLRNAGITNISIDLMFGFPNETLENWEQDIEQAIEQEVQHISAYSLMYEEGTTLYKMRERGIIKENEECISAQMYDMLMQKMQEAGYEHYEISNFAKPGFRSMHNSCYWNGTNYMGLGAAAHSYDTKTRQWNTSDILAYIKAIENGLIPMEQEEIDSRTRYNDIITTALRTSEGIKIDNLDSEAKKYILKNATRSISAGTLEIKNGRMRLTQKGLYVSDEVMSDLIWV